MKMKKKLNWGRMGHNPNEEITIFWIKKYQYRRPYFKIYLLKRGHLVEVWEIG
jgi:hypothetical protein